ANQLCQAAGLGIGCIGTMAPSGMGGVNPMSGMGRMGSALGILSFGLGLLNAAQQNENEAGDQQNSGDNHTVFKSGRFISEPLSPEVKAAILGQTRPIYSGWST